MKESEAASKWCPFGRQILAEKNQQMIGGVTFHPIPAHNRVQNGQQMSMVTPCVASKCACWVVDQPSLAPPGSTNIRALGPVEGDGHCGLAR